MITSVPANDTDMRSDSVNPSVLGRPGPPTISETPASATAIASQVRRATRSPIIVPSIAAMIGASACMKSTFATEA